MITLHHLNNSRSQRILWLLEELGLDYDIALYRRDSETQLAPPELKAVHPLGKSPVITDGERTVAESGAIIDYLVRTHGNGRFRPSPDSEDFLDYEHWLHFAEGSAMLPFLMGLYASRLGEAAEPLWPRIFSEMDNHLSYMENALGSRAYFVGNDLTGADVQLTFVLEAADANGLLDNYPNLKRYLAAMQARDAYRRAIERGGPYALGNRS